MVQRSLLLPMARSRKRVAMWISLGFAGALALAGGALNLWVALYHPNCDSSLGCAMAAMYLEMAFVLAMLLYGAALLVGGISFLLYRLDRKASRRAAAGPPVPQ